MWHGKHDEPTPFVLIVDEFFNKKLLAKMGHTFDGEALTDFQVQAYNVISAQVNKLEIAEMKRKNK